MPGQKKTLIDKYAIHTPRVDDKRNAKWNQGLKLPVINLNNNPKVMSSAQKSQTYREKDKKTNVNRSENLIPIPKLALKKPQKKTVVVKKTTKDNFMIKKVISPKEKFIQV